MKLGEKSHKKIEQFFREYLGQERFVLPAIYFYGGSFTHRLTSVLGIDGITIGRRIYIFPENFWRSENNLLRISENLVVHEIAHVLQYRHEGFGRFLWKYFKSYFNNIRKRKRFDFNARAAAYLEIPFEIEARKIASEFVIWSKNNKI